MSVLIMKKWYLFACVLVVLGVYHLIFDDIKSRMIATFSKANVGDIYNLSDFTKGSVYSLMGIDYIDFHHPSALEHDHKNIVIWYEQGQQKVIYSEFDENTDYNRNQVFLDEKTDTKKIPFGYRCPPNAKIQLIQSQPELQIYFIKPLNCQSLAE